MEEASSIPAAKAGTRKSGRAVSVSLRMLVLIRWIGVTGQAATLLIVHFGLGYNLPIGLALAVVAASALVNIVVGLPRPTRARLGEREAAFYLGYDILQLGLLLFLTGGIVNPFALLMLAPVSVAATILSLRSIIGLCALTVAAASILIVLHQPLPWPGPPPDFPFPYILGVWTALVSSALFMAGYAWIVAEEARRMRDAFAATQLALAREQRVSAVGGLAAAAAHELGSPLATIAVIAKELVRDVPADSPYAEDAALLLSQSERCRTILAGLSRHRGGEGASPFERLPISALVEAAGEPHVQRGVRVIYSTGAQAGEEPLVARSPEILHGLGNLIQNATQFARREVSVATSWRKDIVTVEVSDDGPGFPVSVLSRIGEPYISSRGGDHMGLGIFIAHSLLERTGAELAFSNLPEGGAQVAVEWKRAVLETPEMKPLAREAAG